MNSLMPKIKILAIIAAFILGWIYRDAAIGLLLTIGIGSGLCLLAGFVFSPLSALGRFFFPHGLLAIAAGILLAALPPLPFGGGPIEPVPLAAVPAAQQFALGNPVICTVIGIVAAAALALITVAYARAQCVTDRATHPSIAMAMLRQGRFAGFRVRHATDRNMDIGGTSIGSSISATVASLPAPRPISIPAPTTAQAAVAPAEDPGWLRYEVRPAALFDVVVAELFAGQVDFKNEDAKHASFAVPAAQRDVVDQIVQRVAKAKST